MFCKSRFKSIAAGLICLFLAAPVLISGTRQPEAMRIANVKKSASDMLIEEAHGLYDSIHLKKFGLTKKAFEYAWIGYANLLKKGIISKKEVLSICDFSLSSRRRRLFVIDVEEKKVLVNTYVAHGKNSGGEYARSFSNNPESHMSSLGFYVTGGTYYGEHGLSMKIEGLEKGINDKADARNIVIHGSAYIGPNYIRCNRFNGRSFGCPAVPEKDIEKVINNIKDGSLLFIYHPVKSYLVKSTILNG